jgi:hypothetical protein
MAELAKGWAWPANSRKAHYFIAGEIVALCRKWMYSGAREDDKHESSDNCTTCKRKREKLKNV